MNTMSLLNTYLDRLCRLLLLEAKHKGKVRAGLSTMLRVTCMRGSQSAGVVTYSHSSKVGNVGHRYRVVNGKRTDLTTLLIKKCQAALKERAIRAPQFFQGHTRFATSSIAALPGCHPHQYESARDSNLVRPLLHPTPR